MTLSHAIGIRHSAFSISKPKPIPPMNPKTPPLGWNTWNTFGEKINERLILESVDKFVELGLKDAGYEYVVIDDCWSMRERDPKTDEIVPDPVKFPRGMKFVADYVHRRGLKFGMYSCAGTRTCADYPGSYGHEFLDARTFARWGVDFLKYDYCDMPFGGQAEFYYRRMGQALRLSGRDILFSACNWGSEDVWRWIRTTGAGMYRSTGDIFDAFGSTKEIAVSQLPKFDTSAPGCFNDMDMLTVGMYRQGNVAHADTDTQTFEEYRTQFALWCVYGAPLMLGCDIRKMDRDVLALVTNKELLRIDQDALALQPYAAEEGWPERKAPRVVARLLDGRDLALLFVNLEDQEISGRFHLERVGLPYQSGMKLKMRDVFSRKVSYSGRDTVPYRIPPHACRVYRCTPVEA